MPDIGDLLDAIEGVNLLQLAKETITENSEVIANLNASQLAQGKRSTGKPILPPYQPLTIEIKKTKSGLAAVTSHVTLYDTGQHYRNLYATVKGDDVVIGSRDSKEEKLEKKYGVTIYGLTEESQEELVRGELQGSFVEKFIEATGL